MSAKSPLPAYLVRDVLHEEQREDVVFVLRRVHAAAQLVAALPERGVEVGFAEGTWGWGGGSSGGWGYLRGQSPLRAAGTSVNPLG